MNSDHQRVTIIVPSYNEELFIGNLLENIVHQDYPVDRLEVLIVDGMSTDRTREIILGYTTLYSNIRLIDNERRFVPFALNKGIQMSNGDVIIRMDAHSEYPSDYVSSLVKALEELNADNVGGLWVTTPGNSTPVARAIAAATSSSFGIGNAYYRTGATENRKVDTVPFGCYRRQVFDAIGLFDEELLRNQDDEFNARLIKKGGSIWLIPAVKIIYYARESVASMMRMFFQYGYFKPLVNRKIGTPATFRQLVPPLFVVLLAILIPVLFIHFITGLILAGILGVYFISCILFGFTAARRAGDLKLVMYIPWLFFMIHISYGTGYISGIFRFLLFRWKQKAIKSTR